MESILIYDLFDPSIFWNDPDTKMTDKEIEQGIADRNMGGGIVVYREYEKDDQKMYQIAKRDDNQLSIFTTIRMARRRLKKMEGEGWKLGYWEPERALLKYRYMRKGHRYPGSPRR